MPSARHRRIDGQRVLTGWAMLVYTFLYAPIVVVVIFAFNSNRQVTIWRGFTTHWFGDAWNDPVYRSALTTSLRIALVSSLLSTVLGTAAALALGRMHRRWRLPFDALVYLTLVVPEIVIAVASLIFFVRFHARVGDLPAARPDDDPAGPHGLQRLARDADRARPLRGHGIRARGGELRPRRRLRSRRSARSRCRACIPRSWPR